MSKFSYNYILSMQMTLDSDEGAAAYDLAQAELDYPRCRAGSCPGLLTRLQLQPGGQHVM